MPVANTFAQFLKSVASLTLLCGPLLTSAQGQVSLRVSSDEAIARTWRVVHAKFEQTPTAFYGFLRIQNISPTPVSEARFYAEYYDEAGRLCFTLAFAGEVNMAKNVHPIAAGEVRELDALSANLGPIVPPAEVHLHLISQRIVGQSTDVAAGDTIMHAPITGELGRVTPGRIVEPDLLRLTLDSSFRTPAAVDLVLAQVTVDSPGNPKGVEILESSDPGTRSWLEGFIRRANFFPAQHGFVDVPSTCLVLLRLLNHAEPGSQEALSPLESPWLKAYARNFNGNELPTVMIWNLAPSSSVIRKGRHLDGRPVEQILDPNLYDVMTGGSYWSDAAFIVKREMHSGAPVLMRRWKSAEDFAR